MGPRRSTGVSQGKPSQSNVGIVSGQTLTLNQSAKQGGNSSSVTAGNKGATMALHQSNSATPGYFEGIEQNSSMAGKPGTRVASGYRGHQSNQGGTLNTSQGAAPNDGASLFKQYKEEDGFMRGARIAEKI